MLPPSVDVAAAGASILNLAAVVSALHIHLDLPLPPSSLPPPTPSNDAKTKGKVKVLVYGGSSSCGGLAIRYLLTAGIEVVTTSSPQNRDFVTSLAKDIVGAKLEVLDHTLPRSTIIAALESHGPYTKIFDTIGVPPVTDIISTHISSLGGGSYNTLIPHMSPDPIPENVERKFAAYSWAFDEEKWRGVREWFYRYVGEGLETGVVVPTRTHEVKGGLEGVQGVLDLMMQGGVSGRKLVMDPWA